MISRAPESLLDVILTSFQNEFLYLDKLDIETMLRTMNGYPLSQMHMLALEENYCRKGCAFMFCDVDGVIADLQTENLANKRLFQVKNACLKSQSRSRRKKTGEMIHVHVEAGRSISIAVENN